VLIVLSCIALIYPFCNKFLLTISSFFTASRPLSTSSNASTASAAATAKKHRSRSIFGAFLSSKPTTLQNTDEQGDILNEISRDSFSWDSGDDAVEGGQWKKKLAEDEVRSYV